MKNNKIEFITDGKKVFDINTKELYGYIHKTHKKNSIVLPKYYHQIVMKIPNDVILFAHKIIKTVFYNGQTGENETVYFINHCNLTGFALCNYFDIVEQKVIGIEQYLDEYNDREDVTI